MAVYKSLELAIGRFESEDLTSIVVSTLSFLGLSGFGGDWFQRLELILLSSFLINLTNGMFRFSLEVQIYALIELGLSWVKTVFTILS